MVRERAQITVFAGYVDLLRRLLFVLTNALQRAQVDQDVDQRVPVDDGALATQVGCLDAEFLGLAVDAFIRRPLLVDRLVLSALAIELVADARTGAVQVSRRYRPLLGAALDTARTGWKGNESLWTPPRPVPARPACADSKRLGAGRYADKAVDRLMLHSCPFAP